MYLFKLFRYLFFSLYSLLVRSIMSFLIWLIVIITQETDTTDHFIDLNTIGNIYTSDDNKLNLFFFRFKNIFLVHDMFSKYKQKEIIKRVG